jgi:hypothetical protein
MKQLMNLLIPVVLISLGWYGYSNWVAASADPDPVAPEAAFNCKQALAKLAKDYACRESNACELGDGVASEIRALENRIEQHCN